MKEIIIDVMDNGEVKVETKGFKGASCLAESEFIKKYLGAEMERELKPTYYEKDGIKTTRHLPLCG